jgi:hypothetical protein
MREHIKTAHPIFPMGTFSMHEQGFACVGLESPEKSSVYIAIWRIGNDKSSLEIDVGKYGYGSATAYYPTDANVGLFDSKLRIVLDDKYDACMIKLSK